MELEVEVVYALPGQVDEVRLRVPAGASLLDAVRASGVLERHPELKTFEVGVYGQARPQDSPAGQGDRIELYRPLAMDPKEARRKRARRKRV